MARRLGSYYYSNKRPKRLKSMVRKAKKSRRESYKSLGRIEMERGVSLRGKATLVVFFLIVIVLCYVLFLSSFFSIKRAVLVGNDHIEEEDVKQIIKSIIDEKRFAFFSGSNLFLVDSSKIKSRVAREMPLLESAEVKRHFPDTLKIKLFEREPFAVWEAGSKKYLIDSKGVACYGIEDDVEGLPIILDRLNKTVEINKEVTFPKQINFIKNILGLLKEKTDLEIESISLPNSLGFQVDVKVKQGFVIYFNTERSAESQIRDLENVLNKQLKDNQSIEYIDLRVENWIYYK